MPAGTLAPHDLERRKGGWSMSAAPYGWEYEWFIQSQSENIDRLNEWGAAGWEAVGFTEVPAYGTIMVLMKRPRNP